MNTSTNNSHHSNDNKYTHHPLPQLFGIKNRMLLQSNCPFSLATFWIIKKNFSIYSHPTLNHPSSVIECDNSSDGFILPSLRYNLAPQNYSKLFTNSCPTQANYSSLSYYGIHNKSYSNLIAVTN